MFEWALTILILMAITLAICLVQNWWDGRKDQPRP